MCRRFCTWTCSLAAIVAVLVGGGRAEDPREFRQRLDEAMQETIQTAEPSVACVVVARGEEGKNVPLDDPEQVPDSYGSAVVIDAKGLLLTNYHVVRDATRIHVRLPGDKASYAEIHAADPRSDLAVLRLTDPKVLPLKAIKMGDGGALRKGQLLISLANPFAAGFRDGSPSASTGIVSNLRRKSNRKAASEADRAKSLYQFGVLVQTDAKLNLGCSGGALVNLKGELVGLTTALAAVAGGETPGGFGIALDAPYRRIIDVLRRGEEVEYGFLGVLFDETRLKLPPGEGWQMGTVINGSPAQLAGLRGQEILLSVNDVPITNSDDLMLQVGTLLAGTTCKLKAKSAGGAPQDYTVTLVKYFVPDKFIATKRPPALGGLRVDYTSTLFRADGGRQPNRGMPPGVVIREVVEGSPADTARLQEGKFITEVNGRKVNSPAEYYREMENAAGNAVDLTLLTSEGQKDRVRLEIR